MDLVNSNNNNNNNINNNDNNNANIITLSCSIDGESGMISADLSVVPSGVHQFKCKVIDRYISDPQCSLACNTANGTATQRMMCKDNCRVSAEAISDVTATIKTIEEEAVWTGASIRLQGMYFQTYVAVVLSTYVHLL